MRLKNLKKLALDNVAKLGTDSKDGIALYFWLLLLVPTLSTIPTFFLNISLTTYLFYSCDKFIKYN